MSDVHMALKPLDEVVARRTVAGLDADMIEQTGVSPHEADAVSSALRQYLIGDMPGARAELARAFPDADTVDEILAEFGKIQDAA
jgi:hypothetical protein